MARNLLDDTELRQLEADLRGAPLRVRRNASSVVRRGARMIDREMRKDARGHRHLAHLEDAVSHEMIGPLSAEIGLGPKRGTQGSLAHIIVYGSVNNAPVYDHTAGPRRALPGIAQLFADAAEDSVLGDH